MAEIGAKLRRSSPGRMAENRLYDLLMGVRSQLLNFVAAYEELRGLLSRTRNRRAWEDAYADYATGCRPEGGFTAEAEKIACARRKYLQSRSTIPNFFDDSTSYSQCRLRLTSRLRLSGSGPNAPGSRMICWSISRRLMVPPNSAAVRSSCRPKARSHHWFLK
jgi:hypothetical protein